MSVYLLTVGKDWDNPGFNSDSEQSVLSIFPIVKKVVLAEKIGYSSIKIITGVPGSLGWIQSNNHIMVNGRKKKCIIGSGVR
jgi:hypothetical protein